MLAIYFLLFIGYVTAKKTESSAPSPRSAPVTCDAPATDSSFVKENPTCELDGEKSTDYKVNTVCTYKCKRKYNIVGENNVTCQANGNWTKVPVCEEKLCEQPTVKNAELPQCNRTVRAIGEKNFYPAPAECTFACNHGYKLKNVEAKATCGYDEAWTNLPLCEENWCGPLPPVENGELNKCNGTASGTRGENIYPAPTECTYTCNHGYKLKNEKAKATCGYDGAWKNRPQCEGITCEKPDLIENAKKLQCGPSGSFPGPYKVGAFCKHLCRNGYKPNGKQNNVTCTVSGGWIGASPPSCTEITCEAPTTVLNSQADGPSCNSGVTANSRYKTGTMCTYTCKEGYELTGSSTMKCKQDGTWTNEPICKEKICTELLNPVNGRVSCRKGEKHGSVCTFSCKTGYKLTGSTRLTCDTSTQQNGGWTVQPPTCTEKICTALSSPVNGKVLCPKGEKHGSVCTFSCNTGYKLTGSIQLKCDISTHQNGGWRFQPPTCTEIVCSTLYAKNNQKVSCDKEEKYGSICKFSCNAGYRLTGSKQLTCAGNQLNEGWSSTQPICTEIVCTASLSPTNGAVSCDKGKKLGSVCTFTCKTGYRLTGDEQRTCKENPSSYGRWSSFPPFCTEITCRAIAWPPHGFHNCSRSGRAKFGSVCTFRCNSRYELTNANQPKCVSGSEGGIWSQTPPSCSKDVCDPNPCLPGTCKKVMNRVECSCPEKSFGPRCKSDRLEVKFAKDKLEVNYGDDVDVQFSIATYVRGRASFTLWIDGQQIENYDISDGTGGKGVEKKTTYKVRNVTRDMYVSGKAVLESNGVESKYICSQIVVNGAKRKYVCLRKDECDGTNLLIYWGNERSNECKGTNLLPAHRSLEHMIYVDDGSTSANNKTVGSGITKYDMSGLKPTTHYYISVIPKIMGCLNISNVLRPYKANAMTSSGVPDPADEVTVIKNQNACTASWMSVGVTSGDRNGVVVGYKLKILETIRHMLKRNEPFIKKLNITTRYNFEMKPNTIYNISVGVIPRDSCIDRVETKWSTEQTGSCITGPSSPDEVEELQFSDDDANKFTLNPVPERNGLVSCYFIIVRKYNGTNGTVAPLTDISLIKQANETVADGDSFIAIAFERFTEQKTVGLGSKETTCCDMSGASDTCEGGKTRRRRAADSDTVVRGENRPLQPGDEYEVYTLVSTPSEDGSEPMLKASSPKKFEQKAEESSGSSAGLIAAIVIVCLLLLALLIAGLIYRWHQKKKKGVTAPERLPMRRGNQAADVIIAGGRRQRQRPEDIVDRALAQYSFNLSDLSQVLCDKRANEDMNFLDEFKGAIPNAIKACGLTADIAKLPANIPKNRYRNIVPHDNARVEIRKLPGNEFSDYINATHFDSYNAPGRFIAAQGPKPETVNEFWRMVWEHQCYVIAVLTRLVEKKKVKCAQYWSEDEDQVALYDTITVNLVETTSYGDFLRRKFEITRDKEVREILHYQFIAWPDHGIPGTTSSVFRFYRTVMCSQPESAGPIVVHCSAGVGRTGTFIALDYLTEQIAREEQINIAKVVGCMRIRRPEMVQTLDQYIFIHKLVLELYQFGDTDVDVSDFNRVYNDLKQNAEMEQEFERLDYFLPLDTIQDSSSRPENRNFSRDLTVLPYDRNAVFVQMQPTDKNVPYYNGSNIAAYETDARFIAAQTPTSASAEVFWRTVVDNDVNLMVMLCEKSEPANYCFWPDKSEEAKYGSVTVRNLEEKGDMGCVERTFSVTNKQKKITVSQIFYDMWPEDSTPTSSGVVLEIIANVERHYQALNDCEKKTTLVHCSDGAGRTGAFCTISNLIERLKNENRVDLFRTVKDLRDQRPMMVRTLAQYEFCYQAVSDFLESFDLYGNFR